MKVLRFCICSALGSALRYINERKIESLGMSKPAVNGTDAAEFDLLDVGHFVLVKTQNCAETCDVYEKSLDDISEALTEKVGQSLNGKSMKWYKTEIAQTGIKSFKKKFGLMKLPTTVLLRGPWVYEYTEDFTQEQLAPYLIEHLSDIVIPLEGEDEIDRFIGRHPGEPLKPGETRMIIETGEAGRQNFELIAGGEREFSKYGFVSKGDESDTRGSLRVIKWAKDEVVEKNLDFNDHKKVFEMIIDNQLPSVGEINMSKMRYYFFGQKAFAWVIYDDDISWLEFISKFKSAVKKFSIQFNFLRINPKRNPHFQDFLKEVLKIAPDTTKALVITDLNGPGRFTYSGEEGWSSTKIRGWISDVLNDEVERELQSEPIPIDEQARETELGLRKIVADELAKTLINSETHQILIATSMLCQEEVCESAIKTLKKLYQDQKFIKKHNISINMIDGHHNEFDPKWKFDLTSSPPVWFAKRWQKVEGLEDLKRDQISQSAMEGLTNLQEWIEIKLGTPVTAKSEL